jgi:hypothetical protein
MTFDWFDIMIGPSGEKSLGLLEGHLTPMNIIPQREQNLWPTPEKWIPPLTS